RRASTGGCLIDGRREELRVKSSLGDLRRSPADERRRADPVHFTLGGDNVNWTGEELTRAPHSQSQPALRASLRGAPLPPPRRAV
ncbi:uncharacterized protein LOC134654827, partial [Cydia amplana]|uniref:uncharacterized protein LOC134654827 n=1 Tax=Cydia amplana TaxID=1869771 RepID=UPI002FE5ED6C